jgi:RIO-like serine/threonine protein kinase
MAAPDVKLLKKDIFGEVSLRDDRGSLCIIRDAGRARHWVKWIARWLLAREAHALAATNGTAGIPEILSVDTNTLQRSWIAGEPMHKARPSDIAYFRAAAKMLRQLHSLGVVHNDLAKEPNWLVTEDGQPGIVDFQLAWYSPKRGRLFRLLAHEDLRHMLKHKRTYCPEYLTRRELAILENPTVVSRTWMLGGKPVYLFVTRKLLGWADREGANDRRGK